MNEMDEMVRLVKETRKKCPWDMEQTLKTMINDILEEAQEVSEALEKNDFENLSEELGDLLWATVLMLIIAEEGKIFTIKETLKKTNEKIIRRHPHVFGNEKAETAEDALAIVKKIKENEKN